MGVNFLVIAIILTTIIIILIVIVMLTKNIKRIAMIFCYHDYYSDENYDAESNPDKDYCNNLRPHYNETVKQL